MIKKKIKNLLPLLLCSTLLISGCNSNSNAATTKQENIISNLVTYKNSDDYTDWQGEDFTYIHLEGSKATVDGNGGAVVKDEQILIRTSGTYVIKGTLDDGQIVVDAEDAGNVRLILNGATINSSTTAPIYVKQADKTIISLEEKTENTLSDANDYVYESDNNDEPSAAIYSKDDLTINGSGALTVKGNYNDGIKSNDDLKITGGTIQVTSVDDGIIGRDLLAIKDATIHVTSGGDGLKASNDENKSKGNIALENGKFTIKADGDGVQAENTVAVADGDYTIVTGGGSPETIETRDEGMGGRPLDGFGQENIGSFVDRFLEGIEISEDLKKQLEAAKSMEEIQTILQDHPDVLKQIQENGSMRGPGNTQGDGAPAKDAGDGSNNGNNQSPFDSNKTNNETSKEQNTPSSSQKLADEENEEESISTKGIKAGTNLYVSGGTIKIDSLDDAIHSNKDVAISGGTIKISTGDDGIHADEDVLLSGGDVSIEKSYEGIEGVNITVADGKIHVVSEDDGVNVNGGSSDLGMPGNFGNMPPSDNAPTRENQDAASPNKDTSSATEKENNQPTEEGQLLINGGYLYVNAKGDGLDSNTSIKMTGGTVLVYGPTNDGNGSLDYDETFIIEGGILVASGSSGMAQGISENSSQHTIMMTYSEFQEANTNVFVTDEKGQQIIAVAPEKQFQTLVISTPDLKQNESYTFQSGGILTGDHVDGLYQNANYEEGNVSVTLTLSNVMTYLNEDGVTEGNANNGMNGTPFGRGGFGDQNPFGTEQNDGRTSEKQENNN
ncbi:carbohydrate-binding domain-containing protein [Bacillus sp. FJAT-49711]|uniref:carbohydrate-binding domain-containing protein n=1 Tax=Bacillus sp. FJAT-49711 TaxID=2833585 RepID=UPI001BC8D522|nr:carbohydrate-binding domain-containing protein [Bacillus sp. FJAT-49711]MBS4218861.1 carbohydrate-binding domain-containing protein [Bacillus sp. FJAT-49711]